MASGGSSGGLAGCLPDAAWYHTAFEHIRSRFGEVGDGVGGRSKPVLFVVASDDISWFEAHVLGGGGGGGSGGGGGGTALRNSSMHGSVAIRYVGMRGKHHLESWRQKSH